MRYCSSWSKKCVMLRIFSSLSMSSYEKERCSRTWWSLMGKDMLASKGYGSMNSCATLKGIKLSSYMSVSRRGKDLSPPFGGTCGMLVWASTERRDMARITQKISLALIIFLTHLYEKHIY